MKRKIIINILAGFLFASCNSWLDIKPKLEIDREEIYSTENGFKDALAGCYAKLKHDDLYGKTLTYDAPEYMAQHWVASEGEASSFRRLNYESEHVKSIFKNVYTKMYNTIAQANDLLRYLDEQGGEVITTQETFNRLKGEALATRAFCHFELLRLFGQVPLESATIQVSLPYAEIASEEQVPAYDYAAYTEKLMRDFTDAETLLSISDPLTEYTYAELNDPIKLWGNNHEDNGFRRLKFNYWAVKALQARFYLYIGDKQMAHLYATEVINAQVHGEPMISLSLADDFSNRAYSLPSETLLAFHVYNLDKKAENIFEGQNAISAAESRQKVITDVFLNETFDNRLQLFEEQAIVGGGSTRKVVLKKYWQDDSGLGLEGNQSVSASDNYVTMQMVPVVRLAEMYLIAAETASNLQKSNQLMRVYKGSRNLNHTDYTSLAERESDIMNQYQREFWGEGQMFFTYKRKMTEEMLWGIVRAQEKNYVVPLPDGEF